MRYVGGKSRISKQIRDVILSKIPAEERTIYIEPFVGGGAVLAELAPHFEVAYATDICLDLIMMWEKLQRGWQPVEHEISEAEYARLKDELPSAVRGLVGFTQSFGGKFFGGYARGLTNKGAPRNYYLEGVRNCLQLVQSMDNVQFRCMDYQLLKPSPGAVFYCDPPYEGTTKFRAAPNFSSDKFWQVMDSWVAAGAKVFVSEYKAPEGWEIVGQWGIQQQITDVISKRKVVTETLWHKS